ncbi:MAG: transcription elongation factor GreA [Oligoflexales bacterium]|nr:transcription elongation factor GreA [Oligoflexales bacterium]
MDLIPFTPDGHDSLQKELEHLKNVERHEVIAAIAEARSHGDLKENAEYHAAREKQGMIEARIADLEDKLSRAQIIDMSENQPDSIRFGAWVNLQDEETGEEKKYRIVGDLEANIEQNKLSISSPMARALLGKKLDDVVMLKLPKGSKEFVVLSIDY